MQQFLQLAYVGVFFESGLLSFDLQHFSVHLSSEATGDDFLQDGDDGDNLLGCCDLLQERFEDLGEHLEQEGTIHLQHEDEGFLELDLLDLFHGLQNDLQGLPDVFGWLIDWPWLPGGDRHTGSVLEGGDVLADGVALVGGGALLGRGVLLQCDVIRGEEILKGMVVLQDSGDFRVGKSDGQVSTWEAGWYGTKRGDAESVSGGNLRFGQTCTTPDIFPSLVTTLWLRGKQGLLQNSLCIISLISLRSCCGMSPDTIWFTAACFTHMLLDIQASHAGFLKFRMSSFGFVFN